MPLRLYQFDTDLPVLAVTNLVCTGCNREHIDYAARFRFLPPHPATRSNSPPRSAGHRSVPRYP